MIANCFVPSGMPVHCSGGERSSPSPECRFGIGWPCSKAGLRSLMVMGILRVKACLEVEMSSHSASPASGSEDQWNRFAVSSLHLTHMRFRLLYMFGLSMSLLLVTANLMPADCVVLTTARGQINRAKNCRHGWNGMPPPVQNVRPTDLLKRRRYSCVLRVLVRVR